MASTIKCFKLVLGHKGNKCKGHKWILAILKLRGLVKVRVKTYGKKGERRKGGSVKLSAKRGQ